MVAGLLLLLTLPLRAAERADLLPPPARWTDLPSDVRNVAVDRTGRAWFELLGEATAEEIQGQVEHGIKLKAPWVRGACILLFDSKNRIWLRPDSGPSELWCYDPAKKLWTVRRPWHDPAVAPDPNNLYAHAFDFECVESKSGTIHFAGRLGVYTLSGEDWTYQQFFEMNVQQNRWFGAIKSFNPICFSADDDGVYAWSEWGTRGWTGTLGFWMHDGKQWRQMLTEVGAAKTKGAIRSLAALGGGRLLISPYGDSSPFILRLTAPEKIDARQLTADMRLLADSDFKTREAAQQRILDRGTGALFPLHAELAATKDPEMSARLERITNLLENPREGLTLDGRRLIFSVARGRDAGDNVFLWARQATPDRGQVSIICRVSPEGLVLPAPAELASNARVPFFVTGDHQTLTAPDRRGLARLDEQRLTPLLDDTERNFRWVQAEDPAGRLYITTRCPDEPYSRLWGGQVALLDSRQKETRQTLGATAYDISSRDITFAVDTAGRAWTKLKGSDHPFLSVFENGAWKDAPLPPGSVNVDVVQQLQALEDGGLLMRVGDERNFLLDAGQWKEYPSMSDLVEKNYERLKKVVSDRAGTTRVPLLRRDAFDHLWVNDWNHARLYTGQQWIHLSDSPDVPLKNIKAIFPSHAGKKMLLISNDNDMALAELKDGKIHLERFPMQNYDASCAADYVNRFTIDSHGRSWLSLNNYREMWLDDSGRHESPDFQNARLEDSRGRIWFYRGWDKALVIRNPDAALTRISTENMFPALHGASCFVEDLPGSLWISTSCGLSHFAVEGAADKPTLKRLADYTRGLPRGYTQNLYPDGRGNFWTIDAEANNARLWRIEIPK